MRARNQTVLSEMLRPTEGAIEDVIARYRRVAPAITRFARTISGNEQLRVRLGAHAAAGKDEVVCDPRLFQAAYNRGAPVTPAEVALASALHEVVHLVSTDLDEKRPLPEGWPVNDRPEDPVDLLDALVRTGGATAESLFFTLEDGRQERRGMASYPGARSVLADMYRSAYIGAMRGAGPLGQFSLACFLTCGGYAEREQLEKRIDPRAAAALAETSDLVQDVADADDPWEVALLTLQILEVARAHGLLTDLREDPTVAQQEAADQLDADAVLEAVDRVRLTSPIVKDGEAYGETKRSVEVTAGLSERKGESEIGADAPTDQLLRVSEAATVFLPTGQAGRLIVGPVPGAFSNFATAGRDSLIENARRWGVAQRQVSGELYPLFAANQRRGLRSGYDQGDISPHAALFIGAGLYTRMYERRAARTRRKYAVSLLVDASASMLQPRTGTSGFRSPWGMSAALLGAWTLAHLCDELQIDFEVALFNRSFAARPGDTEWSFTRGRSQVMAGLRQSQGSSAQRLSTTVNHYLVKPFDRSWRDHERLLAGLFWTAAEPGRAAPASRRDPRSAPPVSMFDKASNVDEFNLTYAAERMGRLGAQVRVLVVLADGMTRGSVDALAASVAAIERSGTTVLGIGIGDDTVQTAYHRHQVVTRPDELTRAMVEGVRSALRRSLSYWGMDSWWTRPARPSTNLWKESASA